MAEISDAIVDELLAGYSSPEDLIGPDGLVKQLTARLIERASHIELSEHLGYEKGDPAGRGSGNSRNGTAPAKTLKTPSGEVEVRMPRDRAGTFEPQLVPSGVTHFAGFDDKIISMYAGGMTQGEIASHLEDVYGTKVSKDLISRVTDGVLDDIRAWQSRPLDACYAVLWIDALTVKVKVDGVVRNRPAYLVLGLNLEGRKEALSLVIGTGDESATFWAKVLNQISNRGVEHIGVACCDGLSGLDDAIEAVWGDAWVQTCVVHLIRNSIKHVSYGDRRAVARDLKPVYQATDEDAALAALAEFETAWSDKYPMIAELWQRVWDRFTPFLAFPPEIRRVIYTTNSIEAVNRQLRKVSKNRGHFPSPDAALKLLWLALTRAEQKWTKPFKNWAKALHQFALFFPETIGKHVANMGGID